MAGTSSTYSDLRYFFIGYRAWLAGRHRLTMADAIQEVDTAAARAQGEKVALASVILAGLALALVLAAKQGLAGVAILTLIALGTTGLMVYLRKSFLTWRQFYADMVAMGKEITEIRETGLPV